MVGLSQSQCQSEHNFIIVGGDGAVLTGLHYKNTRLYANDIKVMVGIYFFIHKATFTLFGHLGKCQK